MMLTGLKTWLTAFCFSAVIHALLLTAVASGFGDPCSAGIKEQQYIEVELTQVPLTPKLEDPTRPLVAKVVEARITQVDGSAKVSMTASAAAEYSPGPPGGLMRGGEEGPVSSGSGNTPKGTEARARVGEGNADQRIAVVYAPPPEYPREARIKGLEGTVRARVLVSETGLVQDIQLAAGSGSALLDQAAIDGLRVWRFKPAYQDGRPVAVWAVVPVVFKLN
jgi:TonB family protein